jgi:hypothetical protein
MKELKSITHAFNDFQKGLDLEVVIINENIKTLLEEKTNENCLISTYFIDEIIFVYERLKHLLIENRHYKLGNDFWEKHEMEFFVYLDFIRFSEESIEKLELEASQSKRCKK